MRIKFMENKTNTQLFDSELLKKFNDIQLCVLHNEILNELSIRKLKHCKRYLY